eukprot:scaffold43107_cov69-Phaeocystis_antarctica.AAC.16
MCIRDSSRGVSDAYTRCVGDGVAHPGGRYRGPRRPCLDLTAAPPRPFRCVGAVLRDTLAKAVGAPRGAHQVDRALAAAEAAASLAVAILPDAGAARREAALLQGVRERGQVAVGAPHEGAHPRNVQVPRVGVRVAPDKQLPVDCDGAPRVDGSHVVLVCAVHVLLQVEVRGIGNGS